MLHGLRISLPASLCAAFALVSSAGATEISEITKDEYYAAAYYRQAMDDPRIQKIKQESSRLSTIAKSIRLTPKQLRSAVDKVESLSGEARELAASGIKDGAAGTRVAGRLLDVLINDTEPKHVVAYVRFRGSSAADAVKDAATIASIVAKAAPLVSTLSLAAIHPKATPDSKEAVWAAKIAADRMANIRRERIETYAERLYKPLFEIVDEKAF